MKLILDQEQVLHLATILIYAISMMPKEETDYIDTAYDILSEISLYQLEEETK